MIKTKDVLIPDIGEFDQVEVIEVLSNPVTPFLLKILCSQWRAIKHQWTFPRHLEGL